MARIITRTTRADYLRAVRQAAIYIIQGHSTVAEQVALLLSDYHFRKFVEVKLGALQPTSRLASDINKAIMARSAMVAQLQQPQAPAPATQESPVSKQTASVSQPAPLVDEATKALRATARNNVMRHLQAMPLTVPGSAKKDPEAYLAAVRWALTRAEEVLLPRADRKARRAARRAQRTEQRLANLATKNAERKAAKEAKKAQRAAAKEAAKLAAKQAATPDVDPTPPKGTKASKKAKPDKAERAATKAITAAQVEAAKTLLAQATKQMKPGKLPKSA